MRVRTSEAAAGTWQRPGRLRPLGACDGRGRRTSWLDGLIPDEYLPDVDAIDLDKLWRDGRRLILTDLDNTLVPWNDPEVPVHLQRWIGRARERGFDICIVSNNHGPRVAAFAEQTGLPFIAGARKPSPHGFLAALRRFDCTAREGVMVGDQIFTDIRGGKRAGLYTILVVPIHPREFWGTKVVRQVERVALRTLARRGLLIPPPRRTPDPAKSRGDGLDGCGSPAGEAHSQRERSHEV